MGQFDFKSLNRLLDEYHENKVSFRRDMKKWLHDKCYYGYSVRVESDKVRLTGTGEEISGDDLKDFILRYNLILTYKSRNHIINISEESSFYLEGEYYENIYFFR